jgi:DNA-binding transcriptional regulator YiaG
MTPNGPGPDPMTDEEIKQLREELAAQQDEIRDYLESQGVDTSPWDS